MATGKLLDGEPGTVFVAGDIAYPDGTAEQFRQCYEPAWGRHKNRTRPTPGNHDTARLALRRTSSTSARTPVRQGVATTCTGKTRGRCSR